MLINYIFSGGGIELIYYGYNEELQSLDYEIIISKKLKIIKENFVELHDIHEPYLDEIYSILHTGGYFHRFNRTSLIMAKTNYRAAIQDRQVFERFGRRTINFVKFIPKIPGVIWGYLWDWFFYYGEIVWTYFFYLTNPGIEIRIKCRETGAYFFSPWDENEMSLEMVYMTKGRCHLYRAWDPRLTNDGLESSITISEITGIEDHEERFGWINPYLNFIINTLFSGIGFCRDVWLDKLIFIIFTLRTFYRLKFFFPVEYHHDSALDTARIYSSVGILAIFFLDFCMQRAVPPITISIGILDKNEENYWLTHVWTVFFILFISAIYSYVEYDKSFEKDSLKQASKDLYILFIITLYWYFIFLLLERRLELYYINTLLDFFIVCTKLVIFIINTELFLFLLLCYIIYNLEAYSFVYSSIFIIITKISKKRYMKPLVWIFNKPTIKNLLSDIMLVLNFFSNNIGKYHVFIFIFFLYMIRQVGIQENFYEMYSIEKDIKNNIIKYIINIPTYHYLTILSIVIIGIWLGTKLLVLAEKYYFYRNEYNEIFFLNKIMDYEEIRLKHRKIYCIFWISFIFLTPNWILVNNLQVKVLLGLYLFIVYLFFGAYLALWSKYLKRDMLITSYNFSKQDFLGIRNIVSYVLFLALVVTKDLHFINKIPEEILTMLLIYSELDCSYYIWESIPILLTIGLLLRIIEHFYLNKYYYKCKWDSHSEFWRILKMSLSILFWFFYIYLLIAYILKDVFFIINYYFWFGENFTPVHYAIKINILLNCHIALYKEHVYTEVRNKYALPTKLYVTRFSIPMTKFTKLNVEKLRYE